MLAAYVSHRLAAAHKSGSGFSGITCTGAGAATDFGMLRFATLAQEVIELSE
jgi:hypothetical protein